MVGTEFRNVVAQHLHVVRRPVQAMPAGGSDGQRRAHAEDPAQRRLEAIGPERLAEEVVHSGGKTGLDVVAQHAPTGR